MKIAFKNVSGLELNMFRLFFCLPGMSLAQHFMRNQMSAPAWRKNARWDHFQGYYKITNSKFDNPNEISVLFLSAFDFLE